MWDIVLSSHGFVFNLRRVTFRFESNLKIWECKWEVVWTQRFILELREERIPEYSHDLRCCSL
jgi:hypothetical protein